MRRRRRRRRRRHRTASLTSTPREKRSRGRVRRHRHGDVRHLYRERARDEARGACVGDRLPELRGGVFFPTTTVAR